MKWLSPSIFTSIAAIVFLSVLSGLLESHSIRPLSLLVAMVCLAFALYRIREARSTLVDSVVFLSDHLEIRRGRAEETIDLAAIVKIDDHTFCRPEKIILTLRTPSRFGSRIAFFPIQAFNPFETHPIASALQTRLEELRKEPQR